MNETTILKWLALGATIFALAFSAAGLITYFFTAWPETNSIRFLQNENHPVYTAVYTEVVRTNTTVNNDRMYRLRFDWNGNYGQTNPRFTLREAEVRIGDTVQVRVGNGNAVPLDFERSVHSTLGFIFLGVFGGIGFLAMIGAFVLMAVAKRKAEADI